MSAKSKFLHQPLLLRLLHGSTSLFVIAAIFTGFWTYDTYDGRWGGLPLPIWKEIEGIHGTFGLWALLIFPLFAIYAFHRGQQRLIQSSSLRDLKQIGKPLGWYTLHRLINSITLLALTFALFSGKMMDETWLPQGNLTQGWYYAHLISWVILLGCIALHILMSTKVGGFRLIVSMFNRQFHPQENPRLWGKQLQKWFAESNGSEIVRLEWSKLSTPLKVIEGIILVALVTAWSLPVLLKLFS